MHRGCIVHAPRWNFIKIGKKEGKREGGEELYERYRRRSAIKEWTGGGGRRLGHENRFFSRAAKKRRGRGLDFICVNSSWRKIGCAERDQSVGRNGDSPRRGTPLERVARIFPDCTTTAVVCGYVNRSQSKYICTHRCARCTLRRP